jgi:phage-related protein
VAPAIFHKRALEDIRAFPRKVRKAIGAAIWELQQGKTLALPLSRPMPSIAAGAHARAIA